jgi:hypothetical protein
VIDKSALVIMLIYFYRRKNMAEKKFTTKLEILAEVSQAEGVISGLGKKVEELWKHT